MRQIWTWLLAAMVGLGFAVPAQAHPHVWVTAQAEILYNPDGSVTAIRHIWDFDDAYSAFATQGLDTNKDGKFSRDELKALAQENAESLHEFDYFTSLKIDGRRPTFGQPKEYFMEMSGSLLRLVYVLPLETPVKPKTSLSLEIVDRSFFVAFNLAEGEGAVKLVGAPQGCTVRINRPKTQAPQQTLSEQAFQALGGGEEVGLQFATRAIVACP